MVWLRDNRLEHERTTLSIPPMSDEDAERTIGCAATRRLILDHNMMYVGRKNLKLRPVYAR